MPSGRHPTGFHLRYRRPQRLRQPGEVRMFRLRQSAGLRNAPRLRNCARDGADRCAKPNRSSRLGTRPASCHGQDASPWNNPFAGGEAVGEEIPNEFSPVMIILSLRQHHTGECVCSDRIRGKILINSHLVLTACIAGTRASASGVVRCLDVFPTPGLNVLVGSNSS